ncbi:MAG: helix-turn-helix domain-containing protein [Gemmatimonadaceae bacterium]
MAMAIRKSSGNVFRDVGFPPEEAAHLLIRADLMIEVERLLKARGLTQVQAAKLLRITQPRVSDLVRGRVALFTIDTLVEFLTRLGVSVTVRLKKARRVA